MFKRFIAELKRKQHTSPLDLAHGQEYPRASIRILVRASMTHRLPMTIWSAVTAGVVARAALAGGDV
jgi:hypothetical protein